MNKKQYEQCLREMYSLRRFGIKLGLETIQNILGNLGDPHCRFKSIHIAGTNGKGSIASSLAAILHAAGYKVGLYTSPHLVRFNERIKINNTEISDHDVLIAHQAVKKVHFGDREPTFFEYTTAMAFYLFSLKQVDWAIIETGMGGRLDATNIIQPAVSVVTNLSLEHKDYLGNTIAQIAAEKGGIIKPGTPVVTGVRQKNALAVLNRIALDKTAPLFRLGHDFKVRRSRNGAFNYYGLDKVVRNLRTGLAGTHQVDNAAIAIAVCEFLMRQGDDARQKITLDAIRNGLASNKWPGRLEALSRSPWVLLDGAHNLAAVKNLAGFLSRNLAGRKLTLVAGILNDKDYKAMLMHLLPFCTKIILTQPKIDRSLPPETLCNAVKDKFDDITIVHDVSAAVNHALAGASAEDAVCIAGSLYVIGEVKEAIEKGDVILPGT